MASQNSDQYNVGVNIAAGTLSSGAITTPNPPYDDSGRIRIKRASVTTTTLTGALTAGTDALALFKLPKGAKMHSFRAVVTTSAASTSFKLGISNGGTEFSTAGSNLSTTGAGAECIVTAAAARYVTLTEVTVYLQPQSVNYATTGDVEYICYYSVD